MVRSFLQRHELRDALFDGCAYGLCAGDDPAEPIKKPWRISTNCPQLYYTFHKQFCPGHKYHEPCAGIYTKATENYCTQMVKAIHVAFKAHCHLLGKTDKVYKQKDFSSSFVLPNSNGPAWPKVRRRITTRLSNMEVIRDEWVHNLPKFQATPPLPGGPAKILTAFHY